MKLEVLLASPRKNGNSYVMARRLIDGLEMQKIDSNIIFLYEEGIGPCTDCRACKRGDLVCTIEDGMQPLYARLDAADILVFATPIYWYGPSATMKLLLERLRPYYLNKRLSGKKAVIILPAGNGVADCDLTISMFQRMFKALDLEILRFITPMAFNPGEALSDKAALEQLEETVILLNKLSA